MRVEALAEPRNVNSFGNGEKDTVFAAFGNEELDRIRSDIYAGKAGFGHLRHFNSACSGRIRQSLGYSRRTAPLQRRWSRTELGSDLRQTARSAGITWICHRMGT